jgi:hypothetical protein
MLCKTFKNLAQRTWEEIGTARSIGFQLREGTLTDQNLLHLKYQHPREVYISNFNNPTLNDWEWWLTDNKKWFCFRIKAKIINHITDSFGQLHFPAITATPGSEKFTVKTFPEKELLRIPLYCLYMSTYSLDPKSLKSDVNHYGCSLLSGFEVNSPYVDTNHLKSLGSFLIPWHKLVCKLPSVNLTDHLNAFMEKFLPKFDWIPELYSTANPPGYIRLAYQNLGLAEYTYMNIGLAGIAIFELLSG